MNRSHLLAMLTVVGSAGLLACGKTAVVVAAPPLPPPPVAVVEPPPPPPPPPPRLAAVCDAELKVDGHLHFPNEVEFDTGKSTIKMSDTTGKILQCLVDFLAQNKMVNKFRLEGYTDSQGDEASNMALSEARAKAIVDWMTNHGVDPGKVWAKGYGPKKPVVPNDSPEHMKMNRRVEFHVDEIDGVHVSPDRVRAAMNPPQPVVVAQPAAVAVGVAVPGVVVATPGIAVAAPGVAVAAPGVAVTAPTSVTVGVGTGGGGGKKK
jgi:outer membrane protein OmpA-like peptidoglycan-associated protein